MVTSIFRLLRAANSVVSGGIVLTFNIILAFVHVLINYKYEKDPIKIAEQIDDLVFPIISQWDVFQTLKGSLLRSPRSNPVKF